MASDAEHIISSLLFEQNPRSLPYADDSKPLIYHHLLNLSHSLPSLRIRHDTFVHNDGNSVHGLQVAGTFPITYKRVSYNIPVTIWLLEDYPVAAPRVYLTPTKDMLIKRPHRYVDASGLVSVPYLNDWNHPISNLLGLVRSLGFFFGQDPPLFSLASPAALESRPILGTRVPTAAISPSQRNRAENPAEVFKRNIIKSLEDRLRTDLSQVRETKEAEMNRLINMQSELKRRDNQLQRGVQELNCERNALEQLRKLMLASTESLECWLKKRAKHDLDFNIDDVFEPCDVLSKQLLESKSTDLAIEDTLYSLDKALQEGRIPINNYFKNVRSLAREQFFHRAISAKIERAQHYLQAASLG